MDNNKNKGVYMIRLIILATLLFSTAVTAENMKYKRNDFDNMTMHMKCRSMADKGNLVKGRIDLHYDEMKVYGQLVWDGFSQKDKDTFRDFINYMFIMSFYWDGYVEGFTATPESKKMINMFYMDNCQDDKLAFVTTVK